MRIPRSTRDLPYPTTLNQLNMPIRHENFASNSKNQRDDVDLNEIDLTEKSRNVEISSLNGENSNNIMENGNIQNNVRPSAPYMIDVSETAEPHTLPAIGFINIADQTETVASQPPPPSYDQLFAPESTTVETGTSMDSGLTNHVGTSLLSEFGRNETTHPACKNITGGVCDVHSHSCTTGSNHLDAPATINTVNTTTNNREKEHLKIFLGISGMIVCGFVMWSIISAIKLRNR